MPGLASWTPHLNSIEAVTEILDCLLSHSPHNPIPSLKEHKAQTEFSLTVRVLADTLLSQVGKAQNLLEI